MRSEGCETSGCFWAESSCATLSDGRQPSDVRLALSNNAARFAPIWLQKMNTVEGWLMLSVCAPFPRFTHVLLGCPLRLDHFNYSNSNLAVLNWDENHAWIASIRPVAAFLTGLNAHNSSSTSTGREVIESARRAAFFCISQNIRFPRS